MGTANILLVATLLLSTLPATQPLILSNYYAIISLSQSVTTRVANLRAARGDYAGASRARQISKHIERAKGLGFVKFMFSIVYDYVKNYAWRRDVSPFAIFSTVGELNELISSLSEFIQINSAEQRTAWVSRNHKKLINISKALLRRLLETFRRSGPSKELLEALQKEIVDGDLLKDCLQLGSNDLNGLLQVLKDIATQYYPSSGETDL